MFGKEKERKKVENCYEKLKKTPASKTIVKMDENLQGRYINKINILTEGLQELQEELDFAKKKIKTMDSNLEDMAKRKEFYKDALSKKVTECGDKAARILTLDGAIKERDQYIEKCQPMIKNYKPLFDKLKFYEGLSITLTNNPEKPDTQTTVIKTVDLPKSDTKTASVTAATPTPIKDNIESLKQILVDAKNWEESKSAVYYLENFLHEYVLFVKHEM